MEAASQAASTENFTALPLLSYQERPLKLVVEVILL